ncbi:MAG: elongation factor Tu [Candidatus Riflebacteria bacterium]|nr:elongation factor Tu [Candidatus Riflebacteria bacterium]
MTYAKDIEVEMTFLTTEDGGRRTPVQSGYRSQFYYNGHDWDAVHTYIGTDEVNPGQTIRAYLAFLSPDMHVGRIHPGLEFLIREGLRTVARGQVLQVLELEQSAERSMSQKQWMDAV